MSSIFYDILFILSSFIKLDLTTLASPADNSAVVIDYVSEAFLWEKKEKKHNTQSNLTLIL